MGSRRKAGYSNAAFGCAPAGKEEVLENGQCELVGGNFALYINLGTYNLQEKTLALQKLERPHECDTAL